LAEDDVFEMTYFVSGGTYNLNSINRFLTACRVLCVKTVGATFSEGFLV